MNEPKSKPNTAVAVQKPSALNLMAARMNVEGTKLYDTLKATVFKNATDAELLALVVVSNEYDLNPLLKEIYAFPAKGGGIVPIVSVDGWNKMLLRQPEFDGIEFEFQDGDDGKPYSCTATIHVKGRSHPVKITEYFDECKRNTDPWNNMPRRMLRNRTLCQASRIAFGFSGVKHEDEAIDIITEVLPTEPPPKTIPAKASEPAATPAQSEQDKLQTIVVTAGHTFDQFRQFANGIGRLENADSFASFKELPADLCKSFTRSTTAQNGLLKALAEGNKPKENLT